MHSQAALREEPATTVGVQLRIRGWLSVGGDAVRKLEGVSLKQELSGHRSGEQTSDSSGWR